MRTRFVCFALVISSASGCASDGTAAATTAAATDDSGGSGGADSSGAQTQTTAATDGPADSTTDDSGGPGDDGPVEWPLVTCDPIAPSHCGFPFPSNVYTIADAKTVTGRRVVLPVSMFSDADPEPWSRLDGFSPGGTIMVHLLGATDDGMAGPDTIAVSLLADSPTVLLDVDAGELVPHFAELDRTHSDVTRRTLIIHPARRLVGGHRHIVALRSIVDAVGTPITPSPAFAALRDDTPFDDPSIEARRGLYADIFAHLQDRGVARSEVQLAWDFTVSSDDALTGDLLHMRDETFTALGEAAPAFTIDAIEDDFKPEYIHLRVTGSFEAPLYLDADGAAGTARLTYGPDGRPEPVGTISVPFTLLIPNSALDGPVPLLQHGHGLFGGKGQIEADGLVSLADEYGYALFAVDWMGMAGTVDSIAIALALNNGDAGGMATMFDRLQQGALNNLLAMRAMSAGVAEDPALADLLDPTGRYWYGISQGGILGGVYMATTTEADRGVLDVMGMPYFLLVTRSVDFDTFFSVMRSRWSDPRDVMYVLGAAQMLWDRSEPTAYVHRARTGFAPATPREVLLTAAVGDHQVTTIGAHVMARSIPGLVHLDTGVREVWGLPVAKGSHVGSAYVEYEFGLPADPPCNLPQSACADPHNLLRGLEAAREQIDGFLRTGEIIDHCGPGGCSFPELGGCPADEPTPDVCGS